MTYKIMIHNIETDEIIEREMNAAEKAQLEKDKLESENKINVRTSALAKLAALGLTEDEIAAL